jgi:hypothetical protein
MNLSYIDNDTWERFRRKYPFAYDMLQLASLAGELIALTNERNALLSYHEGDTTKMSPNVTIRYGRIIERIDELRKNAQVLRAAKRVHYWDDPKTGHRIIEVRIGAQVETRFDVPQEDLENLCGVCMIVDGVLTKLGTLANALDNDCPVCSGRK